MNYKIYVKKIEENNNFLDITLCIYNNDEPEFTTVLRNVDQEDGSIKQEEIKTPRKEIIKRIKTQTNVADDYVENEIKKELELFKISQLDKERKINYFKDKVF